MTLTTELVERESPETCDIPDCVACNTKDLIEELDEIVSDAFGDLASCTFFKLFKPYGLPILANGLFEDAAELIADAFEVGYDNGYNTGAREALDNLTLTPAVYDEACKPAAYDVAEVAQAHNALAEKLDVWAPQIETYLAGTDARFEHTASALLEAAHALSILAGRDDQIAEEVAVIAEGLEAGIVALRSKVQEIENNTSADAAALDTLLSQNPVARLTTLELAVAQLLSK